ncbi:MAG: adenylate kinase family protein [Mycoplasmoidaceae bacterium]
MKLILLGPPGSGKGTLSILLVNSTNFKHISTGNLFRDILDNNSDISLKIKKYIYEGKLVPDELTNYLIDQNISYDIKNKNDLIFDGYPRNIEQAKFLEKKCDINLVINLIVDDQIIIKRIIGRRLCPFCGKIYNINDNLLINKNLCNDDKSILIQRKDDNEEIIKSRIESYKQTSVDLIKYYEGKGILFEVDGKDSSDNIYKIIMKKIREINDHS